MHSVVVSDDSDVVDISGAASVGIVRTRQRSQPEATRPQSVVPACMLLFVRRALGSESALKELLHKMGKRQNVLELYGPNANEK